MSIKRNLNILTRPKLIIPVIIILLIVGLLVITIRNMSAPAQGSIEQSPPSTAEVIDPYGHPGSFRGKFVSFTYPAHYKSVPSKITGSYLEVVSYHAVDNTSKQINVGVTTDSLDANSGVLYRRKHPEQYRENSSKLGVEFSRLDGTEDSFFVQHNDLLASVSVTAPYNNQAGDALFVTSSLHWR